MATTPRFGLDFVGNIPWGTHLCLFYETKDDLKDILVPYFAEGLRSNEACMWVTSEPLEHDEAFAALAKVVPNVDRFIESGQLLVLPYTEWHMKGGTFDADRVMQGWLEKEQEALAHSFEGLRLAGNTFWIERSLWDRFTDYEEAVNAVIGEHRMIGVCPYSLEKCTGSDVVDVIRNHVGTIIKKEGAWSVVEDVAHRKATELLLAQERQDVQSLNFKLHKVNQKLQLANKTLEQRVHAAQEELRSLNEELRIANEELQYANARLEFRVQERAEELAAANEELQATTEELKATNEELHSEVEQRSQAERSARQQAHCANALSHIIAAGNQADTLKRASKAMVDVALDMLGLDSGGIFLPDGDAVTPQYIRGYTAAQRTWAQRIPLTQRRVARVMKGVPWISNEYQADISKDVQQMNKRVKSMALIPLISGKAVVGFYQLASNGDHRQFSDQERDLLISIGREAGTVIGRLLTEEALKESETRSRRLIERNFDAVVIHSNGVIQFANEAAARMMKAAAPDELIGMSAVDLATPEYRELLAHRVEEIYRTHKGSKLIEIQITALDGTTVEIELSGTLITYEGKPAVYVIARDVSERKQMEAQLKVYSKHLEGLVEERTARLEHLAKFPAENPNAVLRLAQDGTILYTNSRADALLKESGLLLEELRELSAKAYAAKAARTIEVTDGEHVYQTSVTPIIGNSYVNVYMTDITAQKRVEKALQDAQRLASIGETAAMIGHDLRNPLQGLQYIVDLQKMRFDRTPPGERNATDWRKAAESFERIEEQIFYMDKIVGDLQDYARPLDPKREAVSVPKLVSDVLQSLPHTDGEIDVKADLPDLTVAGEPHLMHRIFSNLFLNAMQAMPQGGTLTINAAAQDGFVTISVSDTGVGIPNEMLDKIFSPLMTGKAKGTGLGLAVVQRIVDAHGGTITFESEKGKGTTFTVTLPASAG